MRAPLSAGAACARLRRRPQRAAPTHTPQATPLLERERCASPSMGIGGKCADGRQTRATRFRVCRYKGRKQPVVKREGATSPIEANDTSPCTRGEKTPARPRWPHNTAESGRRTQGRSGRNPSPGPGACPVGQGDQPAASEPRGPIALSCATRGGGVSRTRHQWPCVVQLRH